MGKGAGVTREEGRGCGGEEVGGCGGKRGVWVWRKVVGCGGGAVLGEIPLFGPGAGSAASAGMTGWGAGVVKLGRRCGGERRWCWEEGWVWAPDQVWGDGSWARASEAARGRFPLGGGNDGEKGAEVTREEGRGCGGERGVGVAEGSARVWRRGGGMRRWCCSRRDTRGKRGYDGKGPIRWSATAQCIEPPCERALVGSSERRRCEWGWVWAPNQVWGDGSWGASGRGRGGVGCCARRDTRGKRGYDGIGGAGMTEWRRVWRRRGAEVGGGVAEGGGMRRWCCSRRDTRGKRGYDGGGGAGMTEWGRVWRRRGAEVGGGVTEGGGMRRWCCSRRDTRGKRGYDGGGGAGMTEWGRGCDGEGAGYQLSM